MQRKKMKKTLSGQNKISNLNKILIALAIVAVLILVFVVMTMQTTTTPFEVKSMPYDFRIKETIGFNTDTDMIHFGGGPAGAGSERSMNITSPQEALVKIRFEGPGSISASDNNFVMAQNESKNLLFYMTYPDLPEGNYSGMVYFEFYPVN